MTNLCSSLYWMLVLMTFIDAKDEGSGHLYYDPAYQGTNLEQCG